MPDAYLVDDGMDSWIVEDVSEAAEVMNTITPLLLLASFDHGLRTADETAVAIGTECVGQVCQAFYRAALVPFDPSVIDWEAAMIGADLPVPNVDRVSGLGWCEDVEDSQALYEWCEYEAEPMFWHAGGIVESSADSGMTWLYLPMVVA